MSAKSLNLSHADAALLDEVDEALATGRPAGGSSTLWLSIARSMPHAEDAFRSGLRTQLTAARPPRHQGSPSRGFTALLQQLLPAVRTRRLFIAAAVLALLVLPIGIAVAQGGLSNVIPHFIRQPVEGLVLVKAPPTTVESDAALQRLLSFPLWVPSDLPCAGPNQRIYNSASRSASLVYQCLHVSERSSEAILRPVVDAGTLEEVSINGLPGYYYQSTLVMPTTGEKQTTAGLVFEREGTFVTLSPLPQHASRDAPELLLGKADLIRIAASMTRVHAQ
ncbi:MAG TPA: hypothetical protein VGR85_01785 [Candidatus Limnocylindria bacterium]|jgi:hypothetical protein|nr:hypothetical protein [Candidatus Limnocylindria bacterium]